MKKQTYIQPTLHIGHIQLRCFICYIITRVEGNADLKYRGGGNGPARAKSLDHFNVWEEEDDWSE